MALLPIVNKISTCDIMVDSTVTVVDTASAYDTVNASLVF